MAGQQTATSVIDKCSHSIQSQVRETIGNILRQEGLGELEQHRDDVLRAETQFQAQPYQFFLQQQQICHDNCVALLKRLGVELHQAVNELLEDLEHNVSIIDASTQLLAPATSPISTRSNDNESGGSSSGSQPGAPVADMDINELPIPHRARSVTLAMFEQPPAAAQNHSGSGQNTDESPEQQAPITPPEFSPSKRSAAETATTTPSKRAKTVKTASSKIVTLSTSGSANSKGKKADVARKFHDPDDDEYRGSPSTAESVPAREIGRRAARAKHPMYIDLPVEQIEFVEP